MVKFLESLSVFAGTVIGVGIFGLPYVAMKSGFTTVLLYFLFITAIAIAIHIMYGRVSLGTEGLHRLPGAVGVYMGRGWKNFTFIVTGLGLVGAILAYLIVGGQFLSFLLSPILGGGVVIYSILFFAAGAFLIFCGIKSISQIELILLFVFLALVVAFFVKAHSLINASYLGSINPGYLALPYGVVLFSLWGSNIVPEIKEILKEKKQFLQWVLVAGLLLAAATYIAFTYIVLGISGPSTSKEAISGLSSSLGSGMIEFGFVFGIIACFTSFLTLGLTLKKIFWLDFGVHEKLSWLIACFLPLALFLVGARQFINVIGLTGAFTVGLMGIIIVLLYREFNKKKFGQKINPLLYSLPVFFILGIAFEVFYFFR